MSLTPLYLKKAQIAELLATTPDNAVRLLAARGCRPVDYGRGRSLGMRWYAPEVSRIAQEMHEEAQEPEKPKKQGKPRIRPGGYVVGRSVSELYHELTSTSPLQ